MEYPLEIEKALLSLAEIDDQLKARRAAIRTLELDTTLDACSAKDEKGKPILSNETMREAAISKMLEEKEEYADLGRQVAGLERDRITVNARLERLRLELKLHILEAEQRNHIAALKVADSIYFARTANGAYRPYSIDTQEIEMPF
jgi:hypothetical protein